MSKRDNQILELLAENKRMEVSAIAEALNVSQVTIRKDLDALENRGILRREHGSAILGGTDDINNRLAFHYEEKQQIARAAAELVHDGETVMIESGSCCALLAEAIVEMRRDVTIITNSAFIADYIRNRPSAHVILLGGDYQNGSQVIVGPLLRLCASQFRVRRFFIGVDGWDAADGFMAQDYQRVQAVRDMAERADNIIVVTESKKFSRPSVIALDIPKGIACVVTDGAMAPETERCLADAGIRVIRAENPIM